MIRKLIIAIAALLVAAAVVFFAYEFLQIGHATPALKSEPERANLIRIEKAARTMTLLRGDQVLKTYKVALGGNPIGDKVQEGDRKTPEGRYAITYKNTKSRYHLSLRISYPDATDIAEAERLGVSPGGDIMIHGLPNGFGAAGANHLLRDWTDGCVAVTNEEIEDIWQIVDLGTEVDIRP
jgi:murein L,D-transpeptidase YafK